MDRHPSSHIIELRAFLFLDFLIF
uniref:Uncharacterized protein n=1 Tax=Anguilla anguilla TaxID=7936 RepID=A0A0E9VLA7_ANGAN